MMAFSDVEEKLEDALEKVIAQNATTAVAGVSIYRGFSMEQLTVPRLEIICAESIPQKMGSTFTGNHDVAWEVAIVVSGDDSTRSEMRALCAVVEDVLMSSDIVEKLNTAGVSGFSVNGRFAFERATKMTSENELKKQYVGRAMCRPSTSEGVQ